jgi:hypothetical protein
LSVRQRKPRVLRSRSAAFRLVALSAVLACAAAEIVFCASPSWAEEGGAGNGVGNSGGLGNSGAASSNGGATGGNGAISGGGGGHGASPHVLWLPNATERWLSNSAARFTAPLRVFLKGAQRASAHAASDLAKTGRTTIGAPLNWLAGKVKTSPNDQDKAMAAVRSGEIVPLESVLKTVEKSVPGDVLSVDLSHDVVGSWNYKITVLTPQGYYRDVNVDAGSNNVTSIRSH